MPQSAAARKPALTVVHPASTSRIERASEELVAIREQIKALEERKKELADRLLVMVKREGEPDEKGKVRYQTDLHKFIVIEMPGRVTVNEAKLKASMAKNGLTPKQMEKIITPARTVGEPSERIGVYERKDGDEGEGDAAS